MTVSLSLDPIHSPSHARTTGKTGEELGLIAVNGKVMESLPANFSCVQVRDIQPRVSHTDTPQYGALFSIFYDLAKDAGVDLHFDTKVVSVDPWTATVTSQDGRQWSSDIIVGADGTESIVRPFVLEDNTLPPDRDDRFTVK